MPFSLHSLKAKILLPLLAVFTVVLTLIAVEHARSFQKDMTVRLEERAEHLANLIYFIGGSAPQPAELQRLVSALGGEQEVRRVIVAAGEPARVVASSEMALVGQQAGELANPEFRRELQEALAVSERKFRFDPEGQDFDYFRPILVSLHGPKGNELHRGAVLVCLDTRFLHAQVVRTTTKAIATSVGTVVLLAACCWILLRRYVLEPVGQINAAMTRFQGGDGSRLIPATSFSGELAQLAAAWNELVKRMQREHANRAEAEDALRRSRDELEVRVASRTADLVRQNEARIQTEEELRWKTAFLEAQADSSLDGILVVNQHGKMLHRNRILNGMWDVPKAILDQDEDEVLLAYVVSLNRHPQKFLERVKHLYAHPDEIGRDEIEFTDGRIMDRYSSPVFGKDGTYYGRVWTFRDITEQKRAEDELRASKRWFQALNEAIPQHVWTARPDGSLDFFNRRLLEYFGLTLEEMVGWKWTDVIHPEDLPECLARWTHATENGVLYDMEFRLKDATGSYRWHLARALPLLGDSGEVIKWFGTSTDISDRKRTEEALRESQSRLQFLLTTTPAVIYSISAGGDYATTFISRNVVEVIGFEPQDFMADPAFWFAHLHPDDAAAATDAFAKFDSVGQLTREYRFRVKDGTYRWMHDEVRAICGPDGKPHEFVGYWFDIHERKRAEAEREAMHRELLETSRAAGMAEVATSVLHNVGNVLNSVNVSATLVSESVKNSKVGGLGRVVALLDEHGADLGAFIGRDPRGRKLPAFLRELSLQLVREQETALTELQSLRENIEHIKDIVAMQQSYARVTGVVEVLQITDLVEDSLRMNGSALTRHGVRVVREYHETPPIQVEKHKVLQILVNLIRNAKCACDEAGVEDKRITLRVEPRRDTLRISVIDNGIGIPVENHTRIFNHGFTTKKDGHGFGLHSGALAATELGGLLSMHSDGPMTGATFTLELPLTASGAK